MTGLTYAKVHGPPANWAMLEVIDNATGLRVPYVLEVNTMEGWVRHHPVNEDGSLVMDETGLVEETLTGRFRIVERKPA